MYIQYHVIGLEMGDTLAMDKRYYKSETFVSGVMNYHMQE